MSRIMSDLQFNMAAGANVVGDAGHGHSRPRRRRVGARQERLHGQGGREDSGEDTGARSEREDNFISFHSKGVSSTRSGPGRRELKLRGFVSINCLEAGWSPTLARRARAGAGLGDARQRGGTGHSGGGFSWSHGGLGAGPAAAGGSPAKVRDVPGCCWRKPCEGSACSRPVWLLRPRVGSRLAPGRGLARPRLLGRPGPTRAQGLPRRGGICPLSVKLNLGLVRTQQKQLVRRAGSSFPAAVDSAGARSHESHPSSFTKFFLLFPAAQPPCSSSFL